jgi:hypothetical protein
MAESFIAAVQDCKKEANLVLYAGGIGVECSGLLPSLKCPGRVAPGACCHCLGLQFAELRLLRGKQPGSGQQEK